MALAANGLSLWGVPPGSPLRGDALDFLQIKALGAPATLLLMVSQVMQGTVTILIRATFGRQVLMEEAE